MTKPAVTAPTRLIFLSSAAAIVALFATAMPWPVHRGGVVPGGPRVDGQQAGPTGRRLDQGRSGQAAFPSRASDHLTQAQNAYLGLLLSNALDKRALRGLVDVRRAMAGQGADRLAEQAARYREAALQGFDTAEHYTAQAMEWLATACLAGAEEIRSQRLPPAGARPAGRAVFSPARGTARGATAPAAPRPPAPPPAKISPPARITPAPAPAGGPPPDVLITVSPPAPQKPEPPPVFRDSGGPSGRPEDPDAPVAPPRPATTPPPPATNSGANPATPAADGGK